MQNIKQLTYRELHNLMTDVKALKAYISTIAHAMTESKFIESMIKLSTNPEAQERLFDAQTYNKNQDMLLSEDYIIARLFPYFHDFEEQSKKHRLLHSAGTNEANEKPLLKYYGKDQVYSLRTEYVHYHRIVDDQGKDLSEDKIHAFRFYYGNAAFWKYWISVATYISYNYRFESPDRSQALDGPIVETNGFIFGISLSGQTKWPYSLTVDSDCCQVMEVPHVLFYVK